MTRLRIRRSTLVLCAFFLLTLAAYILVRPDTPAPVGGTAGTPASSATHPATRPAVATPPATRPAASPSGRHPATAAPRRTTTPPATAAPTPTATTPSPPAATPSPTVTPTGTPTLP